MKFVLIAVLFFTSIFDLCFAYKVEHLPCANEDCLQIESEVTYYFSHSEPSEDCQHEHCKMCHSCSTYLPFATGIPSIDLTKMAFYGFYEFGYIDPFFQRLKRPPKVVA